MRVLHLSSENGWRGGEQQIAYLLDGLTARGVESIVVARKDSDFEKYCRSKGIPVYGFPFSSSIDIRTANAIKKVCIEKNIELVHMHSSKSHSLGVLSAVMGNRAAFVLSRRVDFVPSESWFTKWKYNHPSIEKIICVSHKINSIMQDYIDKPEKSITIHSGIDVNKFKPYRGSSKLRKELNLPERKFIIGNTSALEDHKDYPTFIKTIAILVTKGLPVAGVVVGSGSKENELRELADRLSLSNAITFAGYRKDIPEILPCFDFFLMTSKEEGLGTSVLDAFAARVPVIATEAGGIPEMVRHEETGLLAPIGNSEKLASNIEQLMITPKLKESLIENAEASLQNFSKERTAELTMEVYQQILSARI